VKHSGIAPPLKRTAALVAVAGERGGARREGRERETFFISLFLSLSLSLIFGLPSSRHANWVLKPSNQETLNIIYIYIYIYSLIHVLIERHSYMLGMCR
jgi:Na+-driven multidrug efflux pump